MKGKFWLVILLCLVLFVADVLLGSLDFRWSELLVDGSLAQRIVFDYRLPKALVAVLVGVALPVSGVLMQTVFRNPLAGPYILGVSAGASLGVALFLLGSPLIGIGLASDLGVALSAWLGASVVLVIVLAVSVRLKDIMAVLILGMMLSSAAAALVDLLQYFSSENALKGFVMWAMGSLTSSSSEQIWIMTVCVILGVGAAVASIKVLDVLLLGENYARTMGVNLTRARLVIFAATSLLAGGVTAFCGPIAFVGIAVPHVARMVFRTASHRRLIAASALIGVAVMLFCDIVAGMPFSDTVLPINTVTALFGIPIVILVVVRSRRNKIM
ncbi:MAG: iron ABC transporter permease [Mucinivorans sp.]